MARRFSVWPAYADFFAGLAVVLLGFFVLESKQTREIERKYEELQRRMTKSQETAANVLDAIAEHTRDVGGVTYDRCSPEDVCVNVELQFEPSDDTLTLDDTVALQHVARSIRSVLEQPKNRDVRNWVQIVVEGHTDCRIPADLNGRDAFKYNWDLSAKRASSVLHELNENGLGSTDHYNVVSWGLAASRPKCPPQGSCTRADDPCKKQNRRTTIRLKFDYRMYENTTKNQSETRGTG
jgi:flagellar motor protein MotB